MKKCSRFTAFLTALLVMTGCSSQNTSESSDPSVSDVSVSSVSEAVSESETAEAYAIVSDVTEGLKHENDQWHNDKEEYSEIAEKLQNLSVTFAELKGVNILATDNDIIFIQGIDSTETDGETPVNAYTTYEVGSITKTMTATAVLQLIEQGKLSMADTLGQFFPEYEAGRNITIYQLLHMQSGIYDYVNDVFSLSKTHDIDIETMTEKFLADSFTDEEMLDFIGSLELKHEPGAEMSYSNTNYHLLAMIIEQLTGKSFGEYLQENIFDVCGMEHSSSMKTGDVTSIPELNDKEAVEFTDENGYMASPNFNRGAGDVHSCAADLVMFDRALMNGKLINEDSLKEMFNMDMNYGCGWMAGASDSDRFHSGKAGSYLSCNAVFDTEKYGRVYYIQLYSMTGQNTEQRMASNYNIVKAALK